MLGAAERGGVSAATKTDINGRYQVQAGRLSQNRREILVGWPNRAGGARPLTSPRQARGPLAVVQKLPVPFPVIHRLAAISPNPHPESTLDSARARAAYPPSTGRNQCEDSVGVIGSTAAEGAPARGLVIEQVCMYVPL